LNAASGAKLWSYTTDNMVDSSPAVVNGVVYVATDAGSIYALGGSPTSSPSSTPIPTANPIPTATLPTPTPSATTSLATTASGATVDLSLGGNVTSSQMSNVTIATNQSAKTTTVSFTVTEESGNVGFSNITIPKSAVLYGTTPTIYIDGQPAQNQGYTQDANNYYVWYTTQFTTHQISIEFTTATTSPKPTTQSNLTQMVYGVIVALAIVALVAGVLILSKRRKTKN
jgi:outer membrane protein assembly factor BamB